MLPESKAVRDATYQAGKDTGAVAQVTRELQEATMLALSDELDYLVSKFAAGDDTALAYKARRAEAFMEYNLATERERTMIGNAMRHIHKDLGHLHGKHAAIENNGVTKGDDSTAV